MRRQEFRLSCRKMRLGMGTVPRCWGYYVPRYCDNCRYRRGCRYISAQEEVKIPVEWMPYAGWIWEALKIPLDLKRLRRYLKKRYGWIVNEKKLQNLLDKMIEIGCLKKYYGKFYTRSKEPRVVLTQF